MDGILVFAILSVLIIVISWRSLLVVKSHGFYRFLSWECIAWLFAQNYPYWFESPLSVWQIISWVLLVLSVYPAIAGVILLKKKGKPKKEREDEALFQFEKTTELVDSGVFRYIRHPLYASLILLTWGIFCKHPGWITLAISVVSTACLYLTALYDEKECLSYFGNSYRSYIKRTKRFIPFLF